MLGAESRQKLMLCRFCFIKSDKFDVSLPRNEELQRGYDTTNPANTGLQHHVGMLAFGLEPLAEVEGALLVVEVLHLPHPKLLGLLGGREHFCSKETNQRYKATNKAYKKNAFYSEWKMRRLIANLCSNRAAL